jgi:hypothetical protein
MMPTIRRRAKALTRGPGCHSQFAGESDEPHGEVEGTGEPGLTTAAVPLALSSAPGAKVAAEEDVES